MPGAGAGNIEVGGAEDVYVFQAEARADTIFDAITGSAGLFRWQLTAPNGMVLFDGL